MIREPEDLPVETFYCFTLEDWGSSCVDLSVMKYGIPGSESISECGDILRLECRNWLKNLY